MLNAIDAARDPHGTRYFAARASGNFSIFTRAMRFRSMLSTV